MTSSLFLPAPLGVRFVLVRSGLKRFAAFLLSSLSWHSFLNFSSTTGLSEFGSISSRSTVESEEQDVGYFASLSFFAFKNMITLFLFIVVSHYMAFVTCFTFSNATAKNVYKKYAETYNVLLTNFFGRPLRYGVLFIRSGFRSLFLFNFIMSCKRYVYVTAPLMRQ